MLFSQLSRENNTKNPCRIWKLCNMILLFKYFKQNNLILESHSYWGCQIGFGLGRYGVAQPLNLTMVHQDLWWGNDLCKKERKKENPRASWHYLLYLSVVSSLINILAACWVQYKFGINWPNKEKPNICYSNKIKLKLNILKHYWYQN